jgi:cytochrome c oxidase subunit 2
MPRSPRADRKPAGFTGGTLVGPTWLGLAGEEVELADGSVVLADDDYLRRSILEPQSQVVQGFSPMIFNAQARGMTNEEIEAIIEYTSRR